MNDQPPPPRWRLFAWPSFPNSITGAFFAVVNLVITVILCYIFLWILAWLMFYAKKYGFLPWP